MEIATVTAVLTLSSAGKSLHFPWKGSFPVSLITLLPLVLLSCAPAAALAWDNRILVAQDEEAMKRVIECAVTRECESGFLTGLLSNRKVFFIESGTKMETRRGLFAFSDSTKVHILEGEHRGEDAWVHDRTLYQNKNNVPYPAGLLRACLVLACYMALVGATVSGLPMLRAFEAKMRAVIRLRRPIDSFMSDAVLGPTMADGGERTTEGSRTHGRKRS